MLRRCFFPIPPLRTKTFLTTPFSLHGKTVRAVRCLHDPIRSSFEANPDQYQAEAGTNPAEVAAKTNFRMNPMQVGRGRAVPQDCASDVAQTPPLTSKFRNRAQRHLRVKKKINPQRVDCKRSYIARG
jgi:hypothetical protein